MVTDLILKGYKHYKIWRGTSEYQKTLREELSIVMRTFLPELKNVTDIQGEEIVGQVRIIYDSLKEYYVNLEKLWSSVDDFEKHVTEQVL